MTLRASSIPLRALLAAILALAALALVPQVAMASGETPTEEPAPPPAESEATEEGQEGEEPLPPPPGPPVEEPPVEEPPVEETPPEGTEEGETGEVVPPPVEETPPPAPEPAPPAVIEEEVVHTEILVIPETPDVPVAPRAAISKQAGPPPVAPVAPDKAPPALPTLKAATSPAPVVLPAPSLVDTPPAIPPDPAPPAATPPPTTAGTPLVVGIGRFVPTLGVEQSRPDAAGSPVLPDDGTPAAAVVDPNVARDALGPMSRPDSLIGVLASYVIPGASGPASSFQFMLAFALLLGAFAFARPRNWALALPDVLGRAHAGHGSVGLKPG